MAAHLCLLLLVQVLLVGASREKKEIFETLKKLGPTLGDHSLPQVVQRDALSRVQYDPEKWISEPSMTISGAVMFDRTTGLNVSQCLEKCAKPQYQVCSNSVFQFCV